MTNQHPITPPPELVKQWEINATLNRRAASLWTTAFAAEAAQWGADQELEACCEWLEAYDYDEVGRQLAEVMHAARRTKPPSLKEQALAVLTQYMTGETILTNDSVDTIRRALEQL